MIEPLPRDRYADVGLVLEAAKTSARMSWPAVNSCTAFCTHSTLVVAHGGKDRHPYPVPLRVYDHTIEVLKAAVHKAKLGHSEELAAIGRLDEQARRLEQHASGTSIEALFAEERARSHQYGGRSVFGIEPPPDEAARPLGDFAR